MTPLTPLAKIYERADFAARALPLPPALTQLYGELRLPAFADRPYSISNFVATLDGVVDLNLPRYKGGGPISGSNEHDRMVMGLLRAVADAVVAGAGTLRSAPRHLWTPEDIFPALADDYRQARETLGKPSAPLNVIVTSSGAINLGLPIFQSARVPVLVMTTPRGAEKIVQADVPPHVHVQAGQSEPRVTAKEIITAIVQRCGIPNPLILVEGGPHLIADFFAERLIDEQFLTLAPQIAGRDDASPRLSLVEGKIFAPGNPRWGTLIEIKRAGDFLFLRYAFPAD